MVGRNKNFSKQQGRRDKNTVSRKFEEKKKAVVDKMKEIKSDIEDKWNTVEKFFSTINLRSIGKSIIEGLERGLDDATGGLYSKAKSIAGEIKRLFLEH